MKESKRIYMVKTSSQAICPICGAMLESCHLGEYCSNDNCEGNYCDGYADLNKEQRERFKDIIIHPKGYQYWEAGIDEPSKLSKK